MSVNHMPSDLGGPVPQAPGYMPGLIPTHVVPPPPVGPAGPSQAVPPPSPTSAPAGQPGSPPAFGARLPEDTSPEGQQAWAAYYAHPDFQAAQAAYTDRERALQPLRDYVTSRLAELQPLRDHYNAEMTQARLAAQQRANVPMQQLTQTLQAIDQARAAAAAAPPVPPAPGAMPNGLGSI